MKEYEIYWQVGARMLAQGIDKESLSKNTGITKRTLYLALTQRQSFTLDHVKVLAEALDCSMEDLLEPIPSTYN